MEIDLSQIAPKVNHHGYLQVTVLSRQNHCWHTQRHVYWYKNVMRLSRLFKGLLFWKHSSRLVIWDFFSIVSNVIWYTYYCIRHTMHGNMVFFCTHYITPQQSGGFLVCNVQINYYEISWKYYEISWKYYEISCNYYEISWNNHKISWLFSFLSGPNVLS